MGQYMYVVRILLILSQVVYPHSHGSIYVVHILLILSQVVHPKSDAQRERLIHAVGKIFLFNSLDRVSHVYSIILCH